MNPRARRLTLNPNVKSELKYQMMELCPRTLGLARPEPMVRADCSVTSQCASVSARRVPSSKTTTSFFHVRIDERSMHQLIGYPI